MKKNRLFLFTFFLTISAFAQETKGKLNDTGKSPEAIIKEIKQSRAYLVDLKIAGLPAEKPL